MKAVAAVALVAALAGCGADHVYAPDEAVQRAAYVSDEPPSITLFTVQRRYDGSGGHSAIMINGSQRVIYDPAGTWHHPSMPERNDLHYGITPRMKAFYIDYHARASWDVLEQTVPVSREVADLAIRRAIEEGSSPKGFCGAYVASILRGVPGFESIPATMAPMAISRAFARLPGAVMVRHQDSDSDDNKPLLAAQAAQN
ncbi:MAG: hypothetical protein N2422_04035 [Rhodobacteraceae bacterium]|nr:hypothetical protein [Paracoccaceae bacterium]